MAFCSTRTALLVSMLLGSGALFACSKPKPPAYASDFARRHHCPDSRVSTLNEGEGRKRVSGCGESEVYVYECANGTQRPQGEQRGPAPEPEPNSTPQPASGDSGCAWSREKPAPAANWPLAQ